MTGETLAGDSLQLLKVSEAQEKLLGYFARLSEEVAPLSSLLGRVLAQDIRAEMDLPPFPNSAMDGFAVQAADLSGAHPGAPVVLRVVADIPAGKVANVIIDSGQAARIMTGAPMPAGADAVVPVEETDFNYRQPGLAMPEQVSIFQSTKLGQHIRRAGEDIHQGQVVLCSGQRLRPQEVGFLSMLGITAVRVWRKPRVAIISSGDELLPVEQPLRPGKIHDANSYMLMALVEKYGGEPVSLGIIPDQEAEVKACLENAASQSVDLILSSAGVSVGAFDFVRSVVEQNGELAFWRVNMRPGKPFAFGRYHETPFIGLPGNPVSAFVGFEVFVRPALLKMQGLGKIQHSAQPVQILEAVRSDGRESYLRAVITEKDGHLVARLTGHQGSGNLHSLVQANALLVVPSGVKLLPAGSQAEAWMLDDVQDTIAGDIPA